jgi:hypothetical protein
VSTVTRRRSRRDDEADETREERPTRRRRTAEEPDEDRPTRRRRTPDGDDKGAGVADQPVRRGRRSHGDDDEDGGSRRRRGTRGFASAAAKKRSNSSFADEFRPGDDNPVLIKILDDEPFDSYNQHWVEEGDAAGKTRHSFVCRDDEYFDDDDGCPLCEIGWDATTYALFNILDLSNPRKPVNLVWKASPPVADLLERASRAEKTSPINRVDVYFEAEMVKKGRKREWHITPVKARDLEEDYKLEPFTEEELADFSEDLFTDRTSVTKVDSYDELSDLADSLD